MFSASRLSLLLLMLPAAAVAQDSYGLVSRLGRDTVAVERITRTGNKVVGDLLERSPRVLQRHYEGTLAADGSIELITVDTKIINPDAGRPFTQHVQAHFAGAEMHTNVQSGTDTTVRNTTIPTPGALTMLWLLNGPGSYEMAFNAALKRSGDSIGVDLYTPGGRALSHGFIKRLGKNAASFDFFGMPFTAKFDAQGRMISMSGARTTVKVEVERVSKAPDIDKIAAAFGAAEKANGPAAALSVRDTARATIGAATLLVDYGRPLARGRTILG
ncbi:MAG: hypothetical protein ABIZ70_14535, partial [Gemmatimonadales bacterium]